MSARWSVVTVTHNSEIALQAYWSKGIPSHVQWIVVDNASTDKSVTSALELGASIVIALSKNQGFSAGCNEGLKHCEGENIAFINPDVTVKYEDFDVFEQILSEREVLLSPQLINPDGSAQPNGRGQPYLLHKVLGRLSATRGASIGYYRFSDPNMFTPVSWAIGAGLLGRRSTFEKLGGWNEKFFVYYEDADICLRASLFGISTWVVGGIRWIHGWARGTKTLKLFYWRHEFKSLWTFYHQYPRFLLIPSRERIERP